MKNKSIFGFSVSELMISLSILAILATISFFSFVGYSKDARDSVRITDMKSIKSSLESYYFDTGFYPEPSNSKNIIYDGVTVWKQGTFGDSVFTNVRVLNSLPIDPLFDNKYSYSILNNSSQMELASVLEGTESFSFNYNTVNAAIEKSIAKAYVIGDYNGLLSKVSTGSLDYVLTVPSITTNDLNSLNLVDIVNNGNFVYNNYSNLPDSYKVSKFNTKGGFNFSTNNLVVFSGSLDDLENGFSQVDFLKKLKQAYSGSIITSNDFLLSNLKSLEINTSLPSYKAKLLACNTIKFKLNYDVDCDGLNYIATIIEKIVTEENIGGGGDSYLFDILFNLPGNHISVIFKDSKGNYWFGTNEGVAYFDSTNWQIFNESNSNLINNKISLVTEDLSGNYWILTDKGINKVSSDLSTWSDYTNKQIDFGKNDIEYINTSNNKIVWIGSKNKLTTPFVERSWDMYNKSVSLSTNKVNVIFEDSLHNIWMGISNKGIDKMVYVSSTPLKYEDNIINYRNKNTGNKLPGNEINYIFQDSSLKIWFGTNDGIGILDNDGTTWLEPFNSSNSSNGLYTNKILYLFEDSSNNIWVGTNSGVGRYDGTTWTHYGKADAGANKLKSDNIISIYEDSSGNIIILGDKGIDTIDTSLQVNPINP
ncbi:hypothetical protein CSB08_01105 [Candidatus Gracilibacteria bacterium]|nr:MAG: hypothetical protein CSB08_01105 [Candidatus Gracilibacteria bacterium]